jgi:hypothetical protein
VEPKTLGWENSMKVLKNVFENLEVVSTSLKCFQKCSEQIWWIMEEEEWFFLRKDIGDYVLTQGNKIVQPHYPGMGRGLI